MRCTTSILVHLVHSCVDATRVWPRCLPSPSSQARSTSSAGRTTSLATFFSPTFPVSLPETTRTLTMLAQCVWVCSVNQGHVLGDVGARASSKPARAPLPRHRAPPRRVQQQGLSPNIQLLCRCRCLCQAVELRGRQCSDHVARDPTTRHADPNHQPQTGQHIQTQELDSKTCN